MSQTAGTSGVSARRILSAVIALVGVLVIFGGVYNLYDWSQILYAGGGCTSNCYTGIRSMAECQAGCKGMAADSMMFAMIGGGVGVAIIVVAVLVRPKSSAA